VFVGGFIGSPAMNFFNVIFEGNKITDEDSNFELAVPQGCVKVLNDKGYQGKKLIFGIRPEDLHTENAFLDTFPNAVVSATVVVSELLGAESQLYSKIGNTEVVAKVDGRDIKETGSELKLGFDLNRSHFFDPESEISVY
ncbi:MAG TPA: TOBE domain-containing protein, partial [Candidatus Enterococcus avicola]|nr:TOBE domain-containing protein [Candidatus Enterococcus avicola]